MFDIKAREPLWGEWVTSEVIGEGAYGSVYRLNQTEDGVAREAALKVISIPQNDNEIRQMKADGMDDNAIRGYYGGLVSDITREIEFVTGLRGERHIAAYEECLLLERPGGMGWDILVRMELLEGMDAVSAAPSVEQETLAMGTHICAALEVYVASGGLHGGVKPCNILVAPNGDYKLADFGLGRLIRINGGAPAAESPAYMSPELYNHGIDDPTEDIYALGMVMYRTLNHGRAPFMPIHPRQVTPKDHKEAVARRMGGMEVLPELPGASAELNSILRQACSYDPRKRFQSPAAMLAALRSVAAGSAKAEQAPDNYENADINGGWSPGLRASAINYTDDGWSAGSAAVAEGYTGEGADRGDGAGHSAYNVEPPSRDDEYGGGYWDSSGESEYGADYEACESGLYPGKHPASDRGNLWALLLGFALSLTILFFCSLPLFFVGCGMLLLGAGLPLIVRKARHVELEQMNPSKPSYYIDLIPLCLCAAMMAAGILLLWMAGDLKGLAIVTAVAAAVTMVAASILALYGRNSRKDAALRAIAPLPVIIVCVCFAGLTLFDRLSSISGGTDNDTAAEEHINESQMPGITETNPPDDVQDVNQSDGQEGRVAVPLFVDMELQAALELAKANGFQLNVISERHSDAYEVGYIMLQSVSSSSMAPAGTTISVQVSLGPELVIVPDVTGMAQSEALELLEGLGLEVETRREYSNARSGNVIRQDISAETEVEPGAAIRLTISRGRRPTEEATATPATPPPTPVPTVAPTPAPTQNPYPYIPLLDDPS